MITCNIHHIKDMKAEGDNGFSWLTITTEDGQKVVLFVGLDMSLALESTFNMGRAHSVPQDAEAAMWARAGK